MTHIDVFPPFIALRAAFNSLQGTVLRSSSTENPVFTAFGWRIVISPLIPQDSPLATIIRFSFRSAGPSGEVSGIMPT